MAPVQLHAEGLAQPADLRMQGGLGDVQGISGVREVPLLRENDEGIEGVQIHGSYRQKL